MQDIEIELHGREDPDDLGRFYAACQEAAEEDGHDKIASIRLGVQALDPLAVLDSIYECDAAHFYLEHPQSDTAMAGAEAVVRAELAGASRFADARRFIDEWTEHTVSIGAAGLPVSGPLFFAGLPFFADEEAGANAASPAGCIFVPAWQVIRKGAACVAVANARIGVDTDIAALAQRLWKAYQRFRDSDYQRPAAAGSIRILRQTEVGGAGSFENNVCRALAAIGEGRYQKIVLARAIDVEFDQPSQPLKLLDALRRRFPPCHCFSFQTEPGCSFIGATPETLVRVEGGRLHTEALAGSAPRGASDDEDAALAADLLASEKDAREHRHVVESILRRLKGIATGVELPDQPDLLKLANVQHLRTPINAALAAGADLLSLAEALHPTPALGGSPRAPALADISRWEPFERGLFGGLVGWIDSAGNGQFNVAIRSGLVHQNALRLYAGAGIVAGSDPAKEAAETRLKLQAMLQSIQPT